jgi:hypothetical protein
LRPQKLLALTIPLAGPIKPNMSGIWDKKAMMLNSFGNFHFTKTSMLFRRCLQYQPFLSKLFSGPVPVHSASAKLAAPKVETLARTTGVKLRDN